MNTMKRFGSAGLLVVAVALSMSTPVLAQTTITLTNVAGPKDRDSGASGQATLTDVAYLYSDDWYSATLMYEYDVYDGDLTVRCSGLTPGATYRIEAGSTFPFLAANQSYVTASDNGTVDLTLHVWFVGSVAEWWWTGGWENGYWVYGGTWGPDFSLSVARKRGSKYITVLQGSLPY